MKTIYKSLEGKEQILNQYEEYLTHFDSLLAGIMSRRDLALHMYW
jgi:hypothetical protein